MVTTSLRPVGSSVDSVNWTPSPCRDAVSTDLAEYWSPDWVTEPSVPSHWPAGVGETLCAPTRKLRGA